MLSSVEGRERREEGCGGGGGGGGAIHGFEGWRFTVMATFPIIGSSVDG